MGLVDHSGAVFAKFSLLQGLDEQAVQAADHGAGVVTEPRCDHGVLVDLQSRAVLP